MEEQKVAVEQGTDFPVKWYRYWAFPLLPLIRIRQADQWNTWSFRCSWLFFTLWTLDSAGIGIDISIDVNYAFAGIKLPYCKMGISIHIPFRLGMWLQKHTWRHARGLP
jgi:hypothetical protein